MNHRVRTYIVDGVGPDGAPYRITQSFSAIQARSAGAFLQADGLNISTAKSLICEWNEMAKAQGSQATYSIPLVPADRLSASATSDDGSWSDLCARQGWNESSQASILMDFIREKGLIVELVGYAQERAEGESGEEEWPRDDETGSAP